MKRFLVWLGKKLFPQEFDAEPARPPIRRRSMPQRAKPQQAVPQPPATEKEMVDFSSELGGRIEDGGPGKNVLIRNKYVREDTGTHDTLKIIDESIFEDQEEDGFDPYNTGRFDRSKSWNLRTRK